MNEIEQAAQELAEAEFNLIYVASRTYRNMHESSIAKHDAVEAYRAARLRYDRLVIGEMKDACLAAFRQWDSTPNAQAVEFAWALFHRETYHQDSDEASGWRRPIDSDGEAAADYLAAAGYVEKHENGRWYRPTGKEAEGR